MLKVRCRFPRIWQTLSNTALDMGFSEVIGLTVIPYYISIRDFLNLWLINSFPWSYLISIGIGYLDSHVVSTKFAIDIAHLSSYFAISNHPVTGLIIVTAFRYKFSFFPLLIMTQGTIIYTQILFRGISSDNLAGILPFFYLIVLHVDKCHK